MKHIFASTTALVAPGYNNADYGTTITLPVGRVVWGHPGTRKPATDNKGVAKIGKDGQQMMETSFGLAIPTADFETHVWPHMHAEASKRYPHGAPPHFSWKFKRDTEIDRKGVPYNQREGYAGHVVLTVSTMLEPPRLLRWNGTQWQQMDATEIKCGDYVQAEINFKVNVPADPTNTPGLYVNPQQVAFVGYGAEIVNVQRTDPNQAFGNGPPPLPPGASATPVAGTAPMPGMPAAPGNVPSAPAGAGMPAPSMPGAVTAAPAPNAAPMQQPSAQGGMPGAVGMPAPPPPAPAPVAGPVRPTDPSHIHDNGNGTEQWFVNGAWDGQQHPAPTLPPPAAGFAAGGMPGMPPAR